ncbi:predicted protein [Micromonas commoda]|uniref:F-box domain-containing protein n=1 Tax=Micromonas commoda (strain RCC299 / NOUM17 / CCMP2709) TaxID=296587 RepID=C1E502_MICCC|nr:predicted protein [Micromonas commoda]ACO62804.1 predicted protein [Micromonas commoda]|eukprot:XP_002501546.1 predicted protein [Micromonas commoda]
MEPRRSQRIKISNEGGALGALLRHLPVVFESEVLRHLDVDDLFSLSRVNKECGRAASNASKLARADHYDARCAELSKDPCWGVDPATVHPLLRAFATCYAQEFAEQAEKLRAEVANDRRQSALSSSSGDFYTFPRREIIPSQRLQDATANVLKMLEPRPGT